MDKTGTASSIRTRVRHTEAIEVGALVQLELDALLSAGCRRRAAAELVSTARILVTRAPAAAIHAYASLLEAACLCFFRLLLVDQPAPLAGPNIVNGTMLLPTLIRDLERTLPGVSRPRNVFYERGWSRNTLSILHGPAFVPISSCTSTRDVAVLLLFRLCVPSVDAVGRNRQCCHVCQRT